SPQPAYLRADPSTKRAHAPIRRLAIDPQCAEISAIRRVIPVVCGFSWAVAVDPIPSRSTSGQEGCDDKTTGRNDGVLGDDDPGADQLRDRRGSRVARRAGGRRGSAP